MRARSRAKKEAAAREARQAKRAERMAMRADRGPGEPGARMGGYLPEASRGGEPFELTSKYVLYVHGLLGEKQPPVAGVDLQRAQPIGIRVLHRLDHMGDAEGGERGLSLRL